MHTLVIFMFIYYLLGGLAIGFGLHRLLTHRSFSAPKWLEYCVVTLSIPAGTPLQWVGNHRFHHAHTDKDADPHSPHISGFWYAHVGWYLGTRNSFICLLYSLAGPLRLIFDSFWRPRTNQQYNYLAEDVSNDPYYLWLSKPVPYMLMMWVHGVTVFGIAYFLAGLTGIAMMWIQLTFMYNVCDAIDSIAHIFGEKPYHQKNESRNNFILAIFTLGEGWHANHHAFPRSARHGLLKGQFDWTWQTIKFMKSLGLLWDVYVPDEHKVQKKLKEGA